MHKRMALLLVVAGSCLACAVANGGTKAKNPNPTNGAIGVTVPLLQWTKGDTAIFHNVYLGTTSELTEADLVKSLNQYEMYYHGPGFEAGATYYWRVDEVEGDMVTIHTGDVWSFTTQALTAYHPSPADGAGNVGPEPVLTWMSGSGAVRQHHLYFGDSSDAVSQGGAETDKGMLDLTDTTFTPGALEGLKTYYWRVDEILVGDTIRTGAVWSFTTYSSVDDFESYIDDWEAGDAIWEVWLDGMTNNTGSTVGYFDPPFAEQGVVHGGLQSMPLDYNNVVSPYYSEAERQLESTQDWAGGAVSALTLHFRGRGGNSPGQLYAALEDSKHRVGVVAYPDPNRIAMAAWTRWEIATSEFSAAGVDLAAVEKIYIGVGDRDNPVPGGNGLLYIDDIYIGGFGEALPTAIFAEDFEGLILGPKVDEGLAGTAVWTETPPAGWVIDESGIPGIGDPTTDGVTEWAGWAFADKEWWTTAAEDQNRSQFTRGVGTVAIADPDEWDDADHTDSASAGWYKTFLSTPAIDISSVKPGTLKLTFSSSWRPEFDDDYHQTANVKVSFDGGEPQELFRWESDGGSPNFKPDATNETATFKIDHPGGAQTMVLTFGLFDAGNDWWWAIDNIEIAGEPAQ